MRSKLYVCVPNIKFLRRHLHKKKLTTATQISPGKPNIGTLNASLGETHRVT